MQNKMLRNFFKENHGKKYIFCIAIFFNILAGKVAEKLKSDCKYLRKKLHLLLH